MRRRTTLILPDGQRLRSSLASVCRTAIRPGCETGPFRDDTRAGNRQAVEVALRGRGPRRDPALVWSRSGDHRASSRASAIRSSSRRNDAFDSRGVAISTIRAFRYARIASLAARPSGLRLASAARRSRSSCLTVTRPRRASRRNCRLVAGSVTPTSRATSPIRTPSGTAPRTTSTRHCGNRSSAVVRAGRLAQAWSH